MRSKDTRKFMTKLCDMMEFLYPITYARKANLVVGIGCTGGRHRSVIKNALYEALKYNNHRVIIDHRDIQNPLRG